MYIIRLDGSSVCLLAFTRRGIIGRTTSPCPSSSTRIIRPWYKSGQYLDPGLHNMADHGTIGPRKRLRLAEKILDETIKG